MKSIAILTACSLLMMPAAAIDIDTTGRTWTLSEQEAANCAAEGDCHVVTGNAIVRLQLQAYKAGAEAMAKQRGSRT